MEISVSDLGSAQEKLGTLLKRNKERGVRNIMVGSVGSIAAMGPAALLWRIAEPFKEYIDAARYASGSGIVGAHVVGGMPVDDVIAQISEYRLKHIVENHGLFAEHNKGEGFLEKLRDLRAYYGDAFLFGSTVWQHLTEGVGLVKGDSLRSLLQGSFPVNSFHQTRPLLEIVATDFETLKPVIFSHASSPDTLISQAVVGSCAMRGVFATQKIDNREFVDAAQNETVPLKSVLRDHITLYGPGSEKNLFIFGTFVHTFSRRAPSRRDTLALDRHYGRDEHTKKYIDHRDIVELKGVRTWIFEFDADQVPLPRPESFDIPGIINWRDLRKLIAWLTWREKLEKFLHGVATFLYYEINPEHFPHYITVFKPKLYQKIENHWQTTMNRLDM